jgi:transcriptional regulator with XRE-family HTH domain
LCGAAKNANMAKLQQRKPQKRIVRHYVKQWRAYRGLNQEQLAERVDKSRGLISQIESGSTDLTESMIYALADAFQCAPGDLFRVNPLKEGLLVDITDALKDKPADVQAEALGFVRGLVRNN